MSLIEKKLIENEIYNGRVLKLTVDDISLPNGQQSKREVIRHSGAVCIAPLTIKGELIFVEQYRYAVSQTLLELPAGRIEKGESPEKTGIRELQEETGYISKKTIPLGRLYPTPGYSDEIIWLYACTVAPKYTDTNCDSDEFVETRLIPLEKAVEMVFNDEIIDSKTQIAILKLNELVKKRGFTLE